MIGNSYAILGDVSKLNKSLEDQLKYYWKLLGHENLGFTEIRILEKEVVLKDVFVDSYKDFEHGIKFNYSDKKDIFISVNPRKIYSSKTTDVNYVTNVVLDLDNIQPGFILPADLKDIGYVVNSGRGKHVYIPIKPFKIEDQEGVTLQLKSITQYYRNLLQDQCKVDHVFDLPRVMRCPGTYNTKNGKLCLIEDVTKEIKRIDFNDFLELINIQVTENVQNEKNDIQNLDFDFYRNKVYLLKSYSSPSEKVFHVVGQLIDFGFNQNQIHQIIVKEQYGTPGKNYYEDVKRIYEKISREVETHSIGLYWDHYEKTLGKRPLGFMTGIPSLDDKTGGFMRKELVVVGARPSIGKTTFSMNIVDEFLNRDHKILMFPTEMSFDVLIDKLIAIRCGIPLYKFRKNSLDKEDLDKIKRVSKEIKNFNLVISEIASPTVKQIKNIVNKVNPDILILDYFQRVNTRSGDEYRIDLESFARELKTIAKENNLSSIVFTQLNRLGDDRSPDIKTIRDTDVLEQEADVAIMLGIEDRMQVERLLHLYIQKNRHGELGYVPLTFDTRKGTIKEKQ